MSPVVAPDRVDDLERAFDAPPANVGDPFIHTFLIRPWRLLSRERVRPGDVALCGYVATRAERGVRVGKVTVPRCPECERRLRSR